MQYTFLGDSGLKVSKLAYGNWITCNAENGQEQVSKCVAKAWELGINYFDTAEVYGNNPGEGEVQMGNALKELNVPREKLVISTKI